LLDCGQTKQLSDADVDRLGTVVTKLQGYRNATEDRAALAALGDAVRAYGVVGSGVHFLDARKGHF